MKENWMKKLVDLLNEYEEEKKKETWLRAYEWESYWDWHLIQATNIVTKGKKTPLALIESRSLLKSKDYWFIQRLLEHDKIDYHKISDIMIYSQWRYTWINKTTAQRVDENMSDLLIMILAIEDNPISLLLSFLL